MKPDARRTTLGWLAAALAATALLALGLPGLRLAPGLPLPSVNDDGVFLLDAAAEGFGAGISVNRFLLLLLSTIGAGAVLWALSRALRGARWRTLAAALARGVLLAGVAGAAVLLLVLFAPHGGGSLPELAAPPPAPALRTPLGRPPPLVVWLTAAALLFAAAGAAAWLARAPAPERGGLELFGLEAERARAALLAGGDARDAILRCYARMSAALAEEQGIERPDSTTPREFEDLLDSRGVPRPPVHELTRLFERVRYGGLPPSPAEQARAVACLSSIVDYCRIAPRRERA